MLFRLYTYLPVEDNLHESVAMIQQCHRSIGPVWCFHWGCKWPETSSEYKV